MKRALINYRRRTISADAATQLREIERNFHVRAFGEEMARVNLDMTKVERLRYLDWMRENARRHGVKPEKKSPYDEE